MKYKFIDDLTSDVMFEAYGKDMKEVFENSAEAMFTVICQVDKVGQGKSRKVEVKGKDEKELLLNWLQELIALVDTEGMFFSRFEIKEFLHFRIPSTFGYAQGWLIPHTMGVGCSRIPPVA